MLSAYTFNFPINSNSGRRIRLSWINFRESSVTNFFMGLLISTELSNLPINEAIKLETLFIMPCHDLFNPSFQY